MENFVEIGQIKKPFGVKGVLRIRVEEQYLESLEAASVIFLPIGGSPVPYFIEWINHTKDIQLKLEDVDSPEAAKDLSNQPIYLSADSKKVKTVDPLSLLEDFVLFDKEKTRIGSIREIVEYPQQLIAVVEYEGKEIMIPLAEQLIIEIDEENQKLVMELPEGILDL